MTWHVRRTVLVIASLSMIGFLYLGSRYGLLSEGGEVESNKCTMTHMYPSYWPLSMSHESRFAGKYGLFYYQDETIRRASYDCVKNLSGVPVLFIPGNGGSRRQIRSIASTSARAHNTSTSQSGRIMTTEDLTQEKLKLGINHFDFFSIDLGEELSAFNGGLLRDQSAFVADCVAAILKLYERSISDPKLRPTSVILLGHSMGGVVARSIFTTPNYAPGSVRTILTLSSPHTSAPLLFHRGVLSFYSRVNDMWRTHCNDNYELQHTAVVSIAGGLRDTQVHASLSNLDSVIPCKNHISVVSTSIPDVWMSMDHTSCMWCHQLTSVIAPALAGLLDPSTGQAHESLSFRMENLRHYFESKVPAALHLDSPHPIPPAPTVQLEPTVDDISSADSSQEDHGEGMALLSNSEHGLDGGKIGSDISTPPPRKVSWVAALPIETKKTVARVSGWHKLSNFQVKWDLFQHTQLSNLQILSTVPLDDLNVLLCNSEGLECLDLKKTAVPIPYSTRQSGPHSFQTLKAHFIVTRLKDYNLAGYQYVVVSSSHKAPSNHNQGIYKGEYGHEIFLVAQLTDPLEIITMNGNIIAESEYPLGQSLVSHMSLLDANKYLLYQAQVERNECNTHPLFTPIILSYSPAMREERYEQNSIALRFHEQYLSLNYKRTTQEATSLSKFRVPMTSQEGLHVFIFADPICSYTLVLKPDWPASIDVMLRNFGVLIIGGFAVLAVLVPAIQLRHAEEYPNKVHKRVFSVIAYILTSPWIVVLVFAYTMPVRFPDAFEMLSSPWLSNHSFAMMARPWPAPLIVIILIIASIVALAGWSSAIGVLLLITHKLPALLQQIWRHVNLVSAGNPSSATTASQTAASPTTPTPFVPQHRRNSSVEVTSGAWPGSWCISQPGKLVLLFLALSALSIVVHSAITVFIALLILALPPTADFLLNPQQEDSIFNFRHSIFVLYSPALMLLIPDLLVWINNMHFEYRVLDSYERFAIVMTLHVLLIRFSSPSVTLQRSTLRIHWLLTIIVILMVFYCLFPVYRAADAIFFASILFCFDHIFKIFSTPPQDRFLKAH